MPIWGDRPAWAPAKPSCGGGISEQDGAHRLGGDAPAENSSAWPRRPSASSGGGRSQPAITRRRCAAFARAAAHVPRAATQRPAPPSSLMNSRRSHSITSSAVASSVFVYGEAERLGGLEIDHQLDTGSAG